MRQYNALRPAIAMIELIFAIVIMGIVMMSAPMLISTASKSGYVTTQQEAIAEAASQMNIILGYQWDENNTQEEFKPIVLTTNTPILELEEVNGTNLRAGTAIQSFRKYISTTGVNANASPIGADGVVADPDGPDDIDDFNGTNISLQEEEPSPNADYIETTTINIARTIQYMDDNETGAGTYSNGGGGVLTFAPAFANALTTTNIKRIQVTLTSNAGVNELSKNIILHAFSCNIGSYKLEER